MALGVCVEALVRGVWLTIWWFQQRAKLVFRRGWRTVDCYVRSRWVWDGRTWTTWRPRKKPKDTIPPEKRKKAAA